VAAADWPNWRGPNHDGISPETGLRVQWDRPLPLVWEREVGSAFSSFACVDGKVYTCGTQGAEQVLFCLDADSGTVVWQQPFEEEYQERQGGDGTRATPAVSEGRVYVLGARGRLVCLDTRTGSEIWSTRFSHMPTWGYSGSVLIEGDLAIVSAGGADGSLAAFNKKTGEPVWKSGDDLVGYATPYPFTFENRRYIAAFLGKCAMIAA
jgi:outer membrane protein assembly factor BamB